MKKEIKRIALDFKSALKEVYGDELSALVLFGSHAKNNAHADSDIDFAVVLKNPSTTSTSEIFKISEISQSISIKYGQLVSYIGMAEEKYKNSPFGFYMEVRKDGILI